MLFDQTYFVNKIKEVLLDLHFNTDWCI